MNPPAVTEGYVIITGNRRVAAMQSLGMRVTPVWVVPGVSDKLSYVLAIHDEQTLHKMLKPFEQAELYEELKALYAEETARKKAGSQFGEGGKKQAGAVVLIRHHRLTSPISMMGRRECKQRARSRAGIRGRCWNRSGSSNRSPQTTTKTPMCGSTPPKHYWKSTKIGKSTAATKL